MRRGRQTPARMLGLAVALAVLGPATTAPATTAEVQLPLTLDYELLRAALGRHLHESGDAELILWETADGCGSLVLREPVVGPAGERLRIAGRTRARTAFGLSGRCWGEVSWEGRMEVTARPELGPDWQLRLRDLDTRLFDAAGGPAGVAGRLWDVVKGWVESTLPGFTYDLGPPVTEVRGLLRVLAGTTPDGPLAQALETLRPVGVTVEADAIRVTAAIALPLLAPAAPAPEPALTPEELERWEAVLDSWDGFLVFVVKTLGAASPDSDVRDKLLDLLLSARHDLVAVLGRGPEPGVDPLRQLFLDVWDRVRGIAREATVESDDHSRALRFVAFLAAGDALAALETAAPAVGLEISADGLRRLARALDPAYAGDPVESSEAPDARLQELFRFRDPDAPPRGTTTTPLPSGRRWLTPNAAYAASPSDREWRQVAQRLNRWVPAAGEERVYRDVVGRLLTLAAERATDPTALEERFRTVLRHLVRAVAWQESCWRQFVRKDGRITYLVSRTGDVGIMQVNVRVWRGFFDPQRLRWNAAYNAGAGTEILWQLLVRYGVREGRTRPENGARATYSAYNGGPASYRRYRLTTAPAALRKIDRAFWEKYRLVAAERADDHVLCVPASAVAG